jgi:hypothetical protein
MQKDDRSQILEQEKNANFNSLNAVLGRFKVSEEEKRKAKDRILEDVLKIKDQDAKHVAMSEPVLSSDEDLKKIKQSSEGLVRSYQIKESQNKQEKAREAENYQEVLKRNQEAQAKRQMQEEKQRALKQAQGKNGGLLKKAKKLNDARKMISSPQSIATKGFEKFIKKIPVIGKGVAIGAGAFIGILGGASTIVILLD